MKYEIIRWLFGWMFTSWTRLTPMDIFTAIAEFFALCLVVKTGYEIVSKIKKLSK